MIFVLFIVLFFWLVLLAARGIARTFIGFVLICAVLASAFGLWIVVGVAFAVVALLWLAVTDN